MRPDFLHRRTVTVAVESLGLIDRKHREEVRPFCCAAGRSPRGSFAPNGATFDSQGQRPWTRPSQAPIPAFRLRRPFRPTEPESGNWEGRGTGARIPGAVPLAIENRPLDPNKCRAGRQHLVRISLPNMLSDRLFCVLRMRPDICLEGRGGIHPGDRRLGSICVEQQGRCPGLR